MLWQGLPLHSMQWGAWGGTGMAATLGMRKRLERVGMGALEPTAGLQALSGILSTLADPGIDFTVCVRSVQSVPVL